MGCQAGLWHEERSWHGDTLRPGTSVGSRKTGGEGTFRVEGVWGFGVNTKRLHCHFVPKAPTGYTRPRILHALCCMIMLNLAVKSPSPLP